MSPRTLLRPYTDLFTVPGARAFSAAGWLARLPVSTVGIGTLLLVRDETGSYALAGAVAGVLGLAFALAGPQWARAMDRLGQGRVLRWASTALLLLGSAFLGTVLAGGPRWSWFALAAVTGASAANIGSLVRTRWAHALDQSDRLQTAFAFESIVDELLFVVGPPLVTVLAAAIAPAVGFAAGLVAGVVGGFVLAGLVGTEPPVVDRAAGRATPSARVVGPVLLVVTSTYLAVGAVFGAMDVVVVGFAGDRGSPGVAGLALGCYAGASMISGIVYGLARLPVGLGVRFVGAAVVFAVVGQGLHLVGSLPGLVGLAALAGLATAPVLVAGMSLVESRLPRSGLTEGLAWTTAGIEIGATAGSALAGVAVDAWGSETAMAVPALGAASAGVLAVLGGLLLRRPPAEPVERSATG